MGYVPSDSDPPPEGLRKRAFALANNIGLDRAERLELAEMLLQRDVTSWKHLVHYDVVRLVDAMVGVGLVAVLKDVRDPCRTCGQRESATGKNGQCKSCRDAWEAWTPPPDAADVVMDAVAGALTRLAVGTSMTDQQVAEMAMAILEDGLGDKVLRALHENGYRTEHN